MVTRGGLGNGVHYKSVSEFINKQNYIQTILILSRKVKKLKKSKNLNNKQK